MSLALVSALAGISSLGVALSRLENASVGIPIGAVLFFALLIPWARYIDLAYEDGAVGLWAALMVVVWGVSGAQQATLYSGCD